MDMLALAVCFQSLELFAPMFSIHWKLRVKAGENELEIRVTSLWPNSMIGDASLPDDVSRGEKGGRGMYPANWPSWLTEGKPRPSGRIAFCTRKDVYTRDDALLPSGLIGPVTLQTKVVVP